MSKFCLCYATASAVLLDPMLFLKHFETLIRNFWRQAIFVGHNGIKSGGSKHVILHILRPLTSNQDLRTIKLSDIIQWQQNQADDHIV